RDHRLSDRFERGGHAISADRCSSPAGRHRISRVLHRPDWCNVVRLGGLGGKLSCCTKTAAVGRGENTWALQKNPRPVSPQNGETRDGAPRSVGLGDGYSAASIQKKSTMRWDGSSRMMRPLRTTRAQSRGRRGKRAVQTPGSGCTFFCKPGGNVPLRCNWRSSPGGRRSRLAKPGGRPERLSTKQSLIIWRSREENSDGPRSSLSSSRSLERERRYRSWSSSSL